MIEDEKNLHSGHRKRMRERMLAGSGFSTHELLEMLLAYGIPRKNTNDIAHRLLARFGSLDGVFSASYEELVSVRGIGESCASLIGLVGLLNEARGDDSEKKTICLDSIGKLGCYAQTLFRGMKGEAVYAVLLDGDLCVVDCVRLAGGTATGVTVDVKRGLSEPALQRSSAVAILHNHPDGSLTASDEDLEFVARAAEIFALSGIKIIEHVLVAGDRFVQLMGEMTPSLI